MAAPALVVAVLLGPAGAWAAPGGSRDGSPTGAAAGVAADAHDWFVRMQSAARGANFRGTLVFSVDGALSSSRVGHFVAGTDTVESLESLDGHQQRIVRHNDAVHTLWPQARLAVIERREAPAAWGTTPQAVDALALEHYVLTREGQGRVAGREAVVLRLEPRDALRYAQRLWADRETALMLRADVLAPATGAATRPVLESTAFSSVEIGVRPQPEAALAAMHALEGYRVVRPAQRRTSLESEGWLLARPVAGFRLAGCLLRGMDNAGSRGEAVLQAVFSDGLVHVSVFVEPYRPALHRAAAQAQQGATASLTHRGGEHWFTAVGDVPPSTLKLFVAALERRSP